MTRKEIPQPGLLEAILDGRITSNGAAGAMQLTTGHLRRLKRLHQRHGAGGLIHRGEASNGAPVHGKKTDC